jgi:glycosyltransferase involved in cell wall biosynthesis
MVGTHQTTAGGISTVVRGYEAGGLFDRVDSRYIATHRDGSSLRKLSLALGAYSRVAGSLIAGRAPLIHVHLSSRASFWRKSVICLQALLMRRPYLIHMHGSEFMKFYEEESGRFTRRLIAFILRHAAVVLALSEQWRENLLRIAPDANVEVLPNAVPLPDLRERHENPQSPSVLFLGRLGQRKGTFDLVKAFAVAANRYPQARLICAGDGQIDEIRALAAHLGIAERVTCPGWLSPEQGAEALRAATIFILPSYAEGLPMALLEAMSWGLPVITSPVGGIPQAIRDEENGLLVVPGNVEGLADALCRLLGTPADRSRLGSAARATVEASFSLDACIERLLAIYRRFGIENRA